MTLRVNASPPASRGGAENAGLATMGWNVMLVVVVVVMVAGVGVGVGVVSVDFTYKS